MDEYISRESVINITAETGAWETQNRVRELPAADVQPVRHDTELSSILQDYDIKDTDTLRYILDQYQKIIVGITGGVLSKLVYPAKTVIEQSDDNYHKYYKEKYEQQIDPENLIGIFGTLCDHMVDNGRCDVLCPYAKTKDEDNECEAWRTIQKIRGTT